MLQISGRAKMHLALIVSFVFHFPDRLELSACVKSAYCVKVLKCVSHYGFRSPFLNSWHTSSQFCISLVSSSTLIENTPQNHIKLSYLSVLQPG